MLCDAILTRWLMAKASPALVTVGEHSTQLSHVTVSHFCCRLLDYVGSRLKMHFVIVTFLCKVCGMGAE